MPSALPTRRRRTSKGLQMAENLRVLVRREIDRLRKELDAASGQVAAIRERYTIRQVCHVGYVRFEKGFRVDGVRNPEALKGFLRWI